MGFEDDVEQSLPRPCRQMDDGSKRTCELTSSTVPRGTPFHRLLSHLILHRTHAVATSRVQRNSVPSTLMRRRITANPACQGHDRLFHPAAPGELHRPGLEPLRGLL